MSTPESDFKWYVVQCFTGREKSVKDRILEKVKELGLGHKISEVLVDLETVTEMRRGSKVTREVVRSPGYIYVQAIYDEEVKNTVTDVQDCIRFLNNERDHSAPKPVRPEQMKRILNAVQDNEEIAEKGGVVSIPFKVGQSVKVTRGSFKDFEGVVDEVFQNSMRLKVLVNIFGRNTPVEVDVEEVESI